MKPIFTEKAPSPAGHYSQAIVSGGLVFVSGQLPIHPENGEIKPTIEEQTHQVMNNLEYILLASGSSLDKVVKFHFGESSVITNLQPLTGGASAETWQFSVSDEKQKSHLILRLASPGGSQDPLRIDRETEARVQQLMADAGVPVAPVLFILEEKDGLGPGYVMERIEGEALAKKILHEDKYAAARPKMAKQCGEVLAKIHSVDTALLPPLQKLPAGKMIKTMYSLYGSFGQYHSVFEAAFRWLGDHLPESSPLKLVHGDFRNGNFIVDPEGIRTILDWETAHLGDPMEDLGWLCVNSWRFGEIDKPVGGFGQREDLFSGYESASRISVDPNIVRFWEVFGTLKWGFICIVQAFTHLGGANRSVEQAAIGRRTSESEIDLLNLLTQRY